MTGIASRMYLFTSAVQSSLTMGVGLFDFIISNELHARVCAAAAVSLTQLWAFSQTNMTTLDTNAIYDGYLNPNKVVLNHSGLLCWDLCFTE